METSNSSAKKRIFWLGMHKLLVATELKRLRMLGYEVFNPPYLSSIIDQSAVLDWAPHPDSTLPAEAAAILSSTNFFYDPIPPEAAEVLNQYFEIAIVTIDPNWLKNFLKVYHGKVVYRVYGQPYSLSNYMAENSILDLITERENFWFCPHNEEALHIEDPWIKYLKPRIIPYCLSNDVVELKDSWTFQKSSASQYNNLGLMCPRILDIPFYNHYYGIIKNYFSDKQFKIFGVQILPVSDPQVLGTLERKDFLEFLSKLRAFIYHYSEPATCYLPPIEYMTLGGPVIFLKGCLLSRYFKNLPAPGEARDLSGLIKLAKQLKKGDYELSNEIIKSQEEVRTLYQPNYVWPIFDQTMTEILSTKASPASHLLYNINTTKKNNLSEKSSTEKSILIPFHRLGANIEVGAELNYYSVEGIIRVANLMVRVLTKHYTVIITSHRCDFGKIHGFFAATISDPTKLKILIVENGQENILFKKINSKAKSFSLKIVLLNKIINKIIYFFKNPLIQNIILYLNFSINLIHKMNNTSYVKIINQDKSISHVIIPHYYLFPETCAIKKPILLYLPDYLPHFYKGSLEMGDHWSWRYIGIKLAKKAKIILTNSEFTRNYLPNSALNVKKEKIVYFPLAYLSQQQKKIDIHPFINEIIQNLPDKFIFYPTRDRPSKRLNDFSEIVNIVNNRLRTNGLKSRIYGVLTTKFLSKKQNSKYLISLPTLPDPALTQVYQLASALVFTSENEGNFPTQLNEALYLNIPIIATNIPQITNELGGIFNALQLIDVGDCEKFADAILYTIDNREKVLLTQQKVREYAMKNFSYHQFSTNFEALF